MSRPVPNPGILEIAPYTPGKSPVPEPGRKVFKLSANETPFGPSPKALAVYKEAAALGLGLRLRLGPVRGHRIARCMAADESR